MGQFKFIQDNTLRRDFTITAPDDSVITFKGFQMEYMNPKDWQSLALEKGNDALLDVIVGWDVFDDSEGNELEYSEEAVESIIQVDFVVSKIVDVYGKAISGFDRKNSHASLAAGRRTKPAAATKRRKTKKRRR